MTKLDLAQYILIGIVFLVAIIGFIVVVIKEKE